MENFLKVFLFLYFNKKRWSWKLENKVWQPQDDVQDCNRSQNEVFSIKTKKKIDYKIYDLYEE